MNERLKELATKAKIQMVSEPRLEEFAELIVRECIGVVNDMSPGYQDYRNQIEDAFRSDCIMMLKERFGLENGDE